MAMWTKLLGTTKRQYITFAWEIFCLLFTWVKAYNSSWVRCVNNQPSSLWFMVGEELLKVWWFMNLGQQQFTKCNELFIFLLFLKWICTKSGDGCSISIFATSYFPDSSGSMWHMDSELATGSITPDTLLLT